MSLHEHKVRAEHLRRKACVYVRQSTLAQVHDHQESTFRQYGLMQRAQQLGWSDEQVEIIDDDLGHSASDTTHLRTGFQKLLRKVVTGEVGAILSVEVSRLARQDSEGHRLVEVAALTETLLIDEQCVYDPGLSDDRLLLGLKVLLSSNELRLMHQRLDENKLRKAERGELRINVPVGLLFVPHVGIRIDPDEQVQQAVSLLFDRFRISQRLSAVVRFFHDNELLFPRRKGTWHGQLEWGELCLERTREVLANPLYAGAYVYGRTKRQVIVRGENQIERPRRLLPQDEWTVVRWDSFEGYISREEYEANQISLAKNQSMPHLPARSRRRDGPALLGGLILCGRCGQPMHVGYQGTNGSRSVYLCNARQIHYGETACQRVPGARVDDFVMTHVLAALTPAQIELSLAAVDELECQQAQIARQWEHRIEAARYSAELAQRRYEQVDPANRLVARTLEQMWDASLAEVARLDDSFAAFRRKKPLDISIEQRQSLLTLASDLETIWSAPTTSWEERKDLLQLLIADVTLTRSDSEVTVQIRWLTNEVETGHIALQTRRGIPTSTRVIERISTLLATHSDREIADLLNQEELKPAHGNAFTAQIVEAIRLRRGMFKRQHTCHQ